MIKVYITNKSTGRPLKNVIAHPHPSKPSISLEYEKTDIRIRGVWEILPVGYLRSKIPTNPPMYSIVYHPHLDKNAIGDYYLRKDFHIADGDRSNSILPDDLFEIF